ncbi:hypothetical protein HNQ93_003257 [Hymenobacter luteus]|uniref:STAS/SEC14 domain-containing protein n=2 Tax=Hymenobacter TaxID=89966 RepID=A0A7W9T2I1_9BACT|nr:MULTISPECIES: hypothetical protein [Hymenobacter]MBB4602500.1 hypothetical protein [Hymenobacter latericoloratus]MBB6060391.1 hypothetical protein [Hymenobacter luteus]
MPASVSASAPDFVEFHRRDELGVLVVRWPRPVSPLELQQSYTAALAAARPTRTRFWLVDLRHRGPASEDDTQWVLSEFVPQAFKQLKGRVYWAFLVPAAQLSPEEQQTGSPMVMHDMAHVRLFGTEEGALHWLAGRQHHDSA